jgi:prefoldin subunit 5
MKPMTIDERLEFLVQSTESLHSTTLEHSAQIAKLTTRFEQVAETMGDLAIAVLNHERRLGKLDGAGEEPPTQN